jgi:hypothetical protein
MEIQLEVFCADASISESLSLAKWHVFRAVVDVVHAKHEVTAPGARYKVRAEFVVNNLIAKFSPRGGGSS